MPPATSVACKEALRVSVFHLSACPSHSREDNISNALRKVPQNWGKHHLGLKDKLIRLRWLKVKGQHHHDMHSILVNTVLQEHLEGISSNLAQVTAWLRKFSDPFSDYFSKTQQI